jgi:hypothetical protein
MKIGWIPAAIFLMELTQKMCRTFLKGVVTICVKTSTLRQQKNEMTK